MGCKIQIIFCLFFIFHTDNFKWISGLFVNITNNDSKYNGILPPHPLFYTEQPGTGGWVNRIQFKNFYAGMDMVFLLKHEERSMMMNQYLVEKYNSLQLANLFLAYRVSNRHFDGELFISGRDLIGRYDLPDITRQQEVFWRGMQRIAVKKAMVFISAYFIFSKTVLQPYLNVYFP